MGGAAATLDTAATLVVALIVVASMVVAFMVEALLVEALMVAALVVAAYITATSAKRKHTPTSLLCSGTTLQHTAIAKLTTLNSASYHGRSEARQAIMHGLRHLRSFYSDQTPHLKPYQTRWTSGRAGSIGVQNRSSPPGHPAKRDPALTCRRCARVYRRPGLAVLSCRQQIQRRRRRPRRQLRRQPQQRPHR
jgi:hypothetical protein